MLEACDRMAKGDTESSVASSLASVLWIADQVRNDVVSLRHAALDAVSSLAFVLWVADQVRNDVCVFRIGFQVFKVNNENCCAVDV